MNKSWCKNICNLSCSVNNPVHEAPPHHGIPRPPAWTLTPCGRSVACRSSSRWRGRQRPASQSARMRSLWIRSHHTPPADRKLVSCVTVRNEEILTTRQPITFWRGHDAKWCGLGSTLQDRMFPKAEKVSYRALLSMDLSRFLMKTFPTPDLRSDGSRCDHMILMGLPFTTSKFIVSRALSARTQTCWCEYLQIY